MSDPILERMKKRDLIQEVRRLERLEHDREASHDEWRRVKSTYVTAIVTQRQLITELDRQLRELRSEPAPETPGWFRRAYNRFCYGSL